RPLLRADQLAVRWEDRRHPHEVVRRDARAAERHLEARELLAVLPDTLGEVELLRNVRDAHRPECASPNMIVPGLQAYAWSVLAENPSHGIGDLAEGGVGADGVEDGGDAGIGPPRGRLHAGERRLDAPSVAPGAERPEARLLALLEGGIDAEQGGWHLGGRADELVHPHDDPLFSFYLLLVAVGGGLDLALH